jgi:hypothetical protein
MISKDCQGWLFQIKHRHLSLSWRLGIPGRRWSARDFLRSLSPRPHRYAKRCGRVFCGYFSEMARNKVLEDLLNDDLAQVRGVTEKAMFGGRAWLLHGNLLCGARDDGMLARLGKGNDTWALAIPGIAPMISRGRPMHGWVRGAPEVYENDGLRRKLLDAALDFTKSLPRK